MLTYARVAPGEVGVPAPIARQERCQAHARAHGREALIASREVGDGGDHLRVQLAALPTLLPRTGIAAVLVTGLDRLAADPAPVAALRAEWADAGGALLVVPQAT